MSGADLDRKLVAAVERLGRAIGAARRQAATTLGLSQLGLQIVELLADGRPRRIGRLAAELDITQPTASEAVATLVDRGLVLRQRDPDDGRAVAMRLSTAGEELADDVRTRLAPVLRAEPGTDDAADRGVALRVLLTEIARLQRDGVISVSRNCLTCRHFDPGDPTTTPRCRLLDRDLPNADLRVDCPEHAPVAT
ncbi:MAG: MarR family winged helix-turn-helix transcriptional regulator [Actinomycetota bacterium]